jgi:hypothetical protein
MYRFRPQPRQNLKEERVWNRGTVAAASSFLTYKSPESGTPRRDRPRPALARLHGIPASGIDEQREVSHVRRGDDDGIAGRGQY